MAAYDVARADVMNWLEEEVGPDATSENTEREHRMNRAQAGEFFDKLLVSHPAYSEAALEDPEEPIRCLLCPGKHKFPTWTSLKQHASSYLKTRAAEHRGFGDALNDLGNPPISRTVEEDTEGDDEDR